MKLLLINNFVQVLGCKSKGSQSCLNDGICQRNGICECKNGFSDSTCSTSKKFNFNKYFEIYNSIKFLKI